LVNADSKEFGKGAGRRNNNRTGVANDLRGTAAGRAVDGLNPASFPKLKGEYVVSSDSSSEDVDD
jgi:hypothetical protein